MILSLSMDYIIHYAKVYFLILTKAPLYHYKSMLNKWLLDLDSPPIFHGVTISIQSFV